MTTTTARELYVPDARFKVVTPGAYLDGWAPDGPGCFRGWRTNLQVGDVITCRGHGWGFGSDPGQGVHWVVGGVNCAEFRPSQGGIWNYHPADGYLELTDEPALPFRRDRRFEGMTEFERCRVCGQPDSCGDCDHVAMSDEDFKALKGDLF